jgi:SAM-dependent methyltransferase
MKNWIKGISPTWILKKYRDQKVARDRDEFERKTKGDAVFCPICNSSFKIFGNFGLKNRTNAVCYNCQSLERHRLLYLFFQENLELFSNSDRPARVLHFAPEKAFFEYFSNIPDLNYFPCDLFPENYKSDPTKKVYTVDITNIDFEDNYFDFILCNHVLEHIPDDKRAMSELYRVMSKDGSGIFQVPIDYSRSVTYEDWNIISPEEREKAFGQNDHVRWYGNDYKNRLEKVGFKVDEIDYASKYSTDEIFKFGLAKSEMIYLCRKTGSLI